MRGRLAMCRAQAPTKGGGIAVAVFLHPSEVLNKLCSKNTTSAGLNEVGRGEVFSFIHGRSWTRGQQESHMDMNKVFSGKCGTVHCTVAL